jgi:thiol-disulfide isomerase/thioredoxin
MSKRTARSNPGSEKGQRVGAGRSSRKARQAAAHRRRRRNRSVAIATVAGVVAVVSVMVVVALTRTPEGSRGSGGAGRAGALVQRLPISVLDSVGAGHGITPPKPLPSDTPPLEQDGKPEILYIGAEYCPYCAAERWPLIVALSRFGSFSNLGGTESAAADVYPRTQTFTFHDASYTSNVLAFAAVETNTNQRDLAGGYTPLDQPTAAEQTLLQQYDREPYTTQAGAIPFLMIANRYVSIGASYDPSILQGMTRDQIAQALSDATNPIAQGVDGAANTLTASICQATGGEPSSVCSDQTITKIAQALPTP